MHVSVTILPSSKVDPSLIVDVNDYEKMFAPVTVPASAENNNIAVIRQRPYPGNARGIYCQSPGK